MALQERTVLFQRKLFTRIGKQPMEEERKLSFDEALSEQAKIICQNSFRKEQ